MRYFGEWKTNEDLIQSFSINPNELENVVVIAAHYDCQSYEGYAFVVFRKEGKLYEVHGSHCSCNGLEGQWQPEETTYEALLDRLNKTDVYEINKHGEDFFTALKNGLIDEMFEEQVLLNVQV